MSLNLDVTEVANGSDLIKKAYHKQALQFQPDKNKSPSVTEGIKDTEIRQKYDLVRLTNRATMVESDADEKQRKRSERIDELFEKCDSLHEIIRESLREKWRHFREAEAHRQFECNNV